MLPSRKRKTVYLHNPKVISSTFYVIKQCQNLFNYMILSRYDNTQIRTTIKLIWKLRQKYGTIVKPVKV